MQFKKYQINVVSQAYDDKGAPLMKDDGTTPIKNWKSIGNLIVFKHDDGKPDGYKVEIHMLPTSPTVQIVVTDPEKTKAAADAKKTPAATPDVAEGDIPF